MDGSYSATNIAVGTICITLLLAYHAWLVKVVRSHPEKTVFGVSSHSRFVLRFPDSLSRSILTNSFDNACRKAWVAAIMKGKKDILGIQTLRNLIMASSILASTSIVIIFGFIAFLANVGSRPVAEGPSSNPLSSQFGFVLDHLFGVKVMILLVVLSVTFFTFAQSMRFYNHVGMVINIDLTNDELEECFHLTSAPTDEENATERNSSDHVADVGSIRFTRPGVQNPVDQGSILSRTANWNNNRVKRNSPGQRRERYLNVRARAVRIEFVARMLNRGSMYYTLGMRGYYITFPAMAYLWGPWALLGATLLLVGILRVVDFNLEDLSPSEFDPQFEDVEKKEGGEHTLGGVEEGIVISK
ncbi:hypothetical protein HDU98_001513 [Podochytrium sp. JEL0797]|nr:hypothetical protein HDU98_001513 [Podochytrium sp. JEL0797]